MHDPHTKLLTCVPAWQEAHHACACVLIQALRSSRPHYFDNKSSSYSGVGRLD